MWSKAVRALFVGGLGWPLALVASTALACAERVPPPVERIFARFDQIGEQIREHNELELVATELGFVGQGHTVDDRRVQALLDALPAPAAPSRDINRPPPQGGEEPKLDASRLLPLLVGLSPEPDIVQELPPKALQRFSALLADPRVLTPVIESLYTPSERARPAERWLPPTFTLEISLRNRQRLSVKSKSYAALMLPWVVERDGVSTVSWNPDLTRSIEALLPVFFVSDPRHLSIESLRSRVEHRTRRAHGSELYSEAVEERMGSKFSALQQRFRIQYGRVPIVGFHDAVWPEWSAVLSSDNIRPFRFALTLSGPPGPYLDADREFDLALALRSASWVFTPDIFLRDADAMLARVRSTPWLQRYLAEQPQALVTLQYCNQLSLSGSEQMAFLDQLEGARKKRPFSTPLSEWLSRSIGLRIDNGSHYGIWLLMPDGRSLFLDHEPIGVPDSSLPVLSIVQPDGSLEPSAL